MSLHPHRVQEENSNDANLTIPPLALSQIMLFVDGMNGVIKHNETLQWLYTLTGSPVSPDGSE